VSPDEFRRLRQRLGLTQEQVAQRLGVTLGAVSRWEHGQRRISEPAARLLQLLVDLETKPAKRRR
jgi:putative transcriptional regulator